LQLLALFYSPALAKPRRLHSLWPGSPLHTGQGLHEGHHNLGVIGFPTATDTKVCFAVAHVKRQLPYQRLALASSEVLVVLHDIAERRQGPIMHVRPMQGNIPQRGRLEGSQVAPG
jgi:hypothetical protein